MIHIMSIHLIISILMKNIYSNYQFRISSYILTYHYISEIILNKWKICLDFVTGIGSTNYYNPLAARMYLCISGDFYWVEMWSLLKMTKTLLSPFSCHKGMEEVIKWRYEWLFDVLSIASALILSQFKVRLKVTKILTLPRKNAFLSILARLYLTKGSTIPCFIVL